MAEEQDKLTTTTTDVTIAVMILLVVLGLFGAYLRGIFDLYLGFLDWWYAKNWRLFFIIIAIIFTLLDAALIWFLIFTLRRISRLDEIFPEEKLLEVGVVAEDQEVLSVWEEVLRLRDSANPSDWNMAIIRADGLLDDVLKRFVKEGETMADRLKFTDPGKMPSLDNVWSAHRLRNTIVHGPPQEHTRETIAHALRSYELGLIELGALKKVSSPEKE